MKNSLEKFSDASQVVINFDQSSKEEYENERASIALKFHILNPKDLIKKEDGKWYFKEMNVEEYDKLYSDNDNTELYNASRYKNSLN